EAIQISVSGERADEAELNRIVTDLMANLSGQSNWLTTGERIGRLGQGLLRIITCFGVVAVIVAIVLRGALRGKNSKRKRRRRDQYDDEAGDERRRRKRYDDDYDDHDDRPRGRNRNDEEDGSAPRNS